MYSLNSALIQMTMRRMILAGPQGFPDVLQEQRISSRDVMWLHLLNRRKLEALDRLPISLFRISYDRLDVGRGGLDDDLFERTCIRLTMVTETINFAITNKTNPLISIGFDNEGFDRFRHEPFLRRLMMIQKGGFKVGLRCDLASLELMPDKRLIKQFDAIDYEPDLVLLCRRIGDDVFRDLGLARAGRAHEHLHEELLADSLAQI